MSDLSDFLILHQDLTTIGSNICYSPSYSDSSYRWTNIDMAYIHNIVSIKYFDKSLKEHTIKVIDDIYITATNNYYLISNININIPLNRVSYIEPDSNIEKWYNKNLINATRTEKINNILNEN